MPDYRKMWEDIGVDVNHHDQLCEVLPQAVGDVFLSQENRPEKMDYFDMVLADVHGLRPAELVEIKKNGGKIFGTFCVFVPDEVIIAAGGVPSGLCAGSQFWVPGGEKVLPPNTCPLIKASVGAHLEKTCPFWRLVDVLVGENTCDGKKKAYEILAETIPMQIMDLPQMKRPEDIKKWAHEVELLKDRAEEVTGNTVTMDKLRESVTLINNKKKALERLYNLRKGKTIPISGTDVLLIMQIAYYDDAKRFTQMVNTLCDELEERVENNISVFDDGTKRILVTGTPQSIPNWKIHNLVENCGGAVVCEETCTGSRYFENQVDESAETMDELIYNIADRYMGIHCACFTPNKERAEDIIRYCKEYNIDGVIDAHLKFCQTYDVEHYFIEKKLKEAGIPCLAIETDYTETDTQQLRTRIGAFIELLD